MKMKDEEIANWLTMLEICDWQALGQLGRLDVRSLVCERCCLCG